MLRCIIRPDIPMSTCAGECCLLILTPDVQSACPIDTLLKLCRDAGELEHPVAPFGPDNSLAVSCRNAAKHVGHERIVTCQVLRIVGRATGRVGKSRVLLLEVRETFRDRCRIDLAADLDSTSR